MDLRHDTTEGRPTAPSDFFAHLSEQDRAELTSIGRIETVAKSRAIFLAGEPSTYVYVLRSGLVKIFEQSDLGRQTILWFCLRGEVFGLAEVLAGGFRGVSAQACERCELLCVHSDAFREFLLNHPQAALLSLQALSARLRGLGHVLLNLVSDDVHTRISKLLLRLGTRYGTRVGDEIVLRIPLTHQAISDMIGAARPTVTSALADLKRKGVLSIDGHRIRFESDDRLNES